MNGEGQSRLGFLASGRHTLSHSVLGQSCHTGHGRPDWKTTLDSLSWLQCCECRDAIVQVTDADLHFYAVRALPGKEIGMQFQTGVTGKGWGKGAV